MLSAPNDDADTKEGMSSSSSSSSSSDGSSRRSRRRYDSSVKRIQDRVVTTRAGFSVLQGRRPYNEDRALASSFHETLGGELHVVDLFAVMDGHRGSACSSYIREVLVVEFRRALKLLRESATAADERSATATTIQIALALSLKNIEETFLKRCKTSKERSGSTVIVVVRVASTLIVANIGDCRAVLCEGARAIPLSRDHRPDVEAEAKRLASAGGTLIKAGSDVRVSGNGMRINLSRTIGDIQLKRPRAILSSEPEFETVKLDLKRHRFLVLGSDGLFARLSSKEVVRYARKIRSQSTRPLNARDLASALANRALEKGTWDNVTAMVIFFEEQ